MPEFQAASEATRAAWAWRRYLTAARAGAPEATIEVRYEELAADPDGTAARIAEHIGADASELAKRASRRPFRIRRALAPRPHGASRWQTSRPRLVPLSARARLLSA